MALFEVCIKLFPGFRSNGPKADGMCRCNGMVMIPY